MGETPRRPDVDFDEPDTGYFWEAAAAGRLVYQTCDQCGAVVFWPRRHCTSCLGTDLLWRDSAGAGEVYSFAVIHQHGHPFFTNRIPYVLALIDVDEGFRLLAEVDVDLPHVHVGQRVEFATGEANEPGSLIFRPAADGLDHR